MNATELIQKYASGERDFRGACLCGADLFGANLFGADLRGADLRGADLGGANLCGAKEFPYTDGFLPSPWGNAHIRHDYIRIGCQKHSSQKWVEFSDDEIASMHPDALKWWTRNKPVIVAMLGTLEEAV